MIPTRDEIAAAARRVLNAWRLVPQSKELRAFEVPEIDQVRKELWCWVDREGWFVYPC